MQSDAVSRAQPHICPQSSVAETANIRHDVSIRAGESFSRGYRAWLLFILITVNLLNLADRQGLAAVAPATKLDLRASFMIKFVFGLSVPFVWATLHYLLAARRLEQDLGRPYEAAGPGSHA